MSNKVTTSDAQKFLKSALSDAARTLTVAAKALDSVDHTTASLALYYSDLSAVVENFIRRFVEVKHVEVLPQPSTRQPPPLVPKVSSDDQFSFVSYENGVLGMEASTNKATVVANPSSAKSVVTVVPAASLAINGQTGPPRVTRQAAARKRSQTGNDFIVFDTTNDEEAAEYVASDDDDDDNDDNVEEIEETDDDDDDDDNNRRKKRQRRYVDKQRRAVDVARARRRKMRNNAVSQFFGNSTAYDNDEDTLVTFAPLPEDSKWEVDKIVQLTGCWTRGDLAKWTSEKWFKKLMESVRVAANNGSPDKYARLMTLLNLALFGRVSMERVQREETRTCSLCSREKTSRFTAHIESPFPEEVFKQMSSYGWHVDSGRCNLVFGSNCAEMALRTVYFGSTINDARRWAFKIMGEDHNEFKKAKEFNDVHHFDQRIHVAHAALKEVVAVLDENGRSLVNTDLTIGKNTPPLVIDWVQ